jgi:hypothetical protein
VSPAGSADAPSPYGTGTGTGSGGRGGGPRRLGFVLVGAVFVALAALVAYAMAFGPHRHPEADRTLPAQVTGGTRGGGGGGTASTRPTPTPAATATRHSAPPATPTPALAAGFALRHDPAGFTVAVHDGWSRSAGPDGETVFTSGADAIRLTVVRGRDTARTYGGDPVTYETEKEPELAGFRASSWASSSGLRTLTSNGFPAAEGQFSWKDPATGEDLYGYNLAVLRDGHYDIVLLTGPADQRTLLAQYFQQSAGTFRAGG